VTGWDVDPAARTAAAAPRGADRPRLGGVVVLAVPLPALTGALEGSTSTRPPRHRPGVGQGAVLAELGPALGGRYVGGHPMCGTERSGHEATDPELFLGARWALCLEPGTELPRWLRVAEVALAVGAEVVPATAGEHDDAVAAVSHVPHLLAAALAAAAGEAARWPRPGRRQLPRRHPGDRSDPGFVTAMVQGNAGPTAPRWPGCWSSWRARGRTLVAAGHAVRAARPGGDGARVRVPLERAALLSLGRAGGAVTRRLAAFVEGYVPGALRGFTARPRGQGAGMDDSEIRSRIEALVEEEHRLRESGEHTDEQRARLRQIEEDRDQLWDLIRQRDAKRQYGEDPDEARPRPEQQVEGYLQ
jgi:prephenate dehydrogenase